MSEYKKDFSPRIPTVLPIIPLRNEVLFPQQLLPITIARERSLKLIEETGKDDNLIAILTQKEQTIENPTTDELYHIGTAARVMRTIDMPDGSKTILIQGMYRIKLITFIQDTPYFKAIFEPLRDIMNEKDRPEIDALAANLRNIFKRVVDLSNEITYEQLVMISNIRDPGVLADMTLAFANVSIEDKQDVLGTVDVKERLNKANIIINKKLQTLELGEKIQSDIQSKFSKTQREMYLREQLKAIQKELGEDADTSEIKELKQKIKKAKMPEEARKVAEKELERLSQMHPSSAEYTVSRTYLDWLIELPWSISTKDNLDIKAVQQKLDADHYNLDKVKKRILEYLAVRKLKDDMKGPILCFVGPPGVGKTSLGRSIAEAIGRKFVRISLGGIHDEAEIRGHRRTYIGALPGRIIQGIKKAGSNNPVFMLDEIDKVGHDFRGDPSSALLEVLDPEQNFSFSDHYLEVSFDLSKVMFIATANMSDPILPALKDRMEIIEIPSYVEEDKVHIAFDFLIPKQIKEHGLTSDLIEFTEDAVKTIINSYTREAGVRNLERQIASICRGVAKDVAQIDDIKKATKKIITEKEVEEYLGPKKFFPETAERINETGIAIGLAWTPVGGDILFIEASKMKGKGNLKLTGQLGDVMKESAQAALSYIRAKAEELKIDDNFHENYDIHIHIPAGAIPKDGPSAGVTLYTALLSLLTGRKVRSDVALTGEITLRGLVLPVGGIKEKVLAAHRAGIRTVALPKKNEKDLVEIPDQIRKEMNFVFLEKMSEIEELMLEKEEQPKMALSAAG
ncbi:MAG: endopeptidase La [candidate division KSB1 bacterium]|nr:endopeptidase La [candidate division KSB1 bacterium]MDZ7333593.1 endopeptidase La [candidate division KSB1 bacterium]MDZ7357833.1 endopeptidase La [candidate division KSB1 bacterium]MDZ7398707.1 endopeptidase La [candidate division KSB1 bacterium]